MKKSIVCFKAIVAFIIITTIVFSLVSCSLFSFDRSDVRGGSALDEKELEDIKNEIFFGNPVEENSEKVSESDNNETEDSAETFYWAENGSMMHIDRYCRYIKNSKTVTSGTKEEAELCGIDEICSACLQNAEETSHGGTDNIDGPFFWTPNGKTWHSNRDCSYIVKSDEIIGGTEEEAIAAGKTKLCSACANNDESVSTAPESSSTESDIGETDSDTSTEGESKYGPCFWTENGSVWHTDKECYHIKKSDEVFSGTEDEAIEAGKEKLCSSCSKNEETASAGKDDSSLEEGTTAEKENDEKGSCYWTESGSAWHTDRECYHIKDSDNVIRGTESEAIDAGKTKLCSSCARSGENESEENGDAETQRVCYWVKSSSLWHTHKDCVHIRGSMLIISGTEEEAIAAGKSKLCSTCATLDADDS